jgi:hypothetical protein
MTRTINDLNTTDTLAGDDKLVIWKDQAGATRAITAADAADYFSLSGGPYQPLDEMLTSIAATGPTSAAGQMFYTTAQDTVALANYSTIRGLISAQPLDATLTAVAGLTVGAGDYVEATGVDTFRARKLTVATYAALTVIAAASRFDDMLVYVSSRATDGDGGEGWWRFDAASSAAANGGTILAPDAGSGRWIRQGTSYIDPLWFGAVGNDSTDNATALTAAFLAAAGREIVFPAGNFRTSVKHTFSGVDVSLRGAGMNISNIIWTGSTGATVGLDITVTNDEQFVKIHGLAFKTTTTTTLDPADGVIPGIYTSKIALKIDGSSQISGGVLQNRSEKRVSISNFAMSGINDSLSTGWDVGVHLKSVMLVAINDWFFLGRFNPPDWVGYGVIVSGLGVPTEYVFSDFRIYSARIGFYFADYSEGVYISDFDIVNVRAGIVAVYVSGVSEVASQSFAGLLQPNIGPGHINCRGAAINLFNTNQGTFNDLNLYVTPISTDGASTALSVNGGALNVINAVRISYLDGGVHTAGQNACVLTNISQSTITNLMVSAADSAGLILTGDTASSANAITGCVFSSIATGIVYDTNASRNVEMGTVFDTVTTPRVLTNGNNTIYRKTFAESPVVTLTGGAATEIVDFTLPTGTFSAKPQSGFLFGIDSDQYLGFYDYDSASSTATNARFLISRAQGGNVNAGLRRFNLMVSE